MKPPIEVLGLAVIGARALWLNLTALYEHEKTTIMDLPLSLTGLFAAIRSQYKVEALLPSRLQQPREPPDPSCRIPASAHRAEGSSVSPGPRP